MKSYQPLTKLTRSWQLGCFPRWWLIVLIFRHMVAVHQSQQQMAIMPFPIKSMLQPLKGLAVDKQSSLWRLHAPVLGKRFWCIRQSNPKTDRGGLYKKIMMFIPESHVTYLNEAEQALYLRRILYNVLLSHISITKARGVAKILKCRFELAPELAELRNTLVLALINTYWLPMTGHWDSPLRSTRFI